MLTAFFMASSHYLSLLSSFFNIWMDSGSFPWNCASFSLYSLVLRSSMSMQSSCMKGKSHGSYSPMSITSSNSSSLV
jgi:hypothetical protein